MVAEDLSPSDLKWPHHTLFNNVCFSHCTLHFHHCLLFVLDAQKEHWKKIGRWSPRIMWVSIWNICWQLCLNVSFVCVFGVCVCGWMGVCVCVCYWMHMHQCVCELHGRIMCWQQSCPNYAAHSATSSPLFLSSVKGAAGQLSLSPSYKCAAQRIKGGFHSVVFT